ncbi:MAG TPA: hypothetical protein VF501_07350 [Thiobacillus sp.]
MTLHAMKEDEIRLLRNEIEMLMSERRQLLQVTGAAAVFVANLDTDSLPDETDTIDAAEMLAEQLNGLSEETLKDALESVRAEVDPVQQ